MDVTKKEFKTFTISLMGSMPRSKRVLEVKRNRQNNTISQQEYSDIIFEETKKIVDLQVNAGVDIITNGELDRDNYISFVSEKVNGIKIMTNEEIIDFSVKRNKEGFEESLIERDADTADIKNPIVYDKIDTNAKLEYDSMLNLMGMTDLPVKATIPSPYLLARTTWLTGVSDLVYSSREELGKDIVTLISNEVKRLIDLGVAVIQLDDPILAEIVLADDEDETFY